MDGHKSEATPVVAPFTVLIDTREQCPWDFLGMHADADQDCRPLYVPTKPATLRSGDYALLGGQCDGAIERKSVADLVGTVFHGRERFEAEMERLDLLSWSYVIVEGCWQEIWEHIHYRTDGGIKAFNRSIDAWVCRFPGVHWWFMPGRQCAMLKAYALMHRQWEDAQ